MNDHEKDLQAEELADLARRLEAALEVDAPDARREKALFVAGAGARARRSPWGAALIPATAAVAVLVVLAVVSRTALPGQTLYPVRKVLGGVGLAPSAAGEIRALLDEAERLVVAAEGAASSAPARAQEFAARATARLETAERFVDELEGERAESFEREIDALADRADEADDRADETLDEREDAEEPDDDGGRDDSSGRGSGGGDSGDDDSSGSGSGGDDDSGGGDSSGSGSGGDDSGGDDSSGSGSGGGDSSGSGSGGDSSGSGSGGDGD